MTLPSGIYSIRNSLSGRTYVGSSKNIAQRWAGHVAKLRAGKHEIPSLQSDWTTYGSDAFSLATLEIMEHDDHELNAAERRWCERLASSGVQLYCRQIAGRRSFQLRLPGLRRQRLLAALTQDQLASKAGIQRQTIVRLEQDGEATPTTLRKLADALACSPKALMEPES